MKVLDLHLHGLASLDCSSTGKLRLFQLKNTHTHARTRNAESVMGPTAPDALCYPELMRGQCTHLVFQLSNLSLAGRVVLQVIQHDLRISQKGFGALQVFPEALFRLHISVANLECGTQQQTRLLFCLTQHLHKV